MITATTPATPATDRVPLASMARAGAIAALVAALGTTLLHWIASAAGLMDPNVATPMGSGIGLGAVLTMSILAAAIATLLFALLVRWVPRPGAVFVVVSALVFAGFVPGPLGLGAPAGMVVVLETMHVVVALSIVALLLRTLRRDERRD